MTVAIEGKTFTIDEFMALPDAEGYELVEGLLVERKPMGALSNYVAGQIIIWLGLFCAERKVGHVFPEPTTYRCFGDPDTGRRPDLSFIASGRFPNEEIPSGYIEIPADLAVEVVSPNDLAYEVEEKVNLYLRHGFGEVWVVYPNTRTLHVFRKGEPSVTLEADQVVRGRGPLEGFECPISRFFPAAKQ